MITLHATYDGTFDLVGAAHTFAYCMIILGIAAVLLLPFWLYGSARLLRQVYHRLFADIEQAIAEITERVEEEQP